MNKEKMQKSKMNKRLSRVDDLLEIKDWYGIVAPVSRLSLQNCVQQLFHSSVESVWIDLLLELDK